MSVWRKQIKFTLYKWLGWSARDSDKVLVVVSTSHLTWTSFLSVTAKPSPSVQRLWDSRSGEEQSRAEQRREEKRSGEKGREATRRDEKRTEEKQAAVAPREQARPITRARPVSFTQTRRDSN